VVRNLIVFVVLACNYYTDHRVKQEVETLLKNKKEVFVLCWPREKKIKNYNSTYLKVQSVRLLSSNKYSEIKFIISAILFQFYIIAYGFKLILNHSKIIIHSNDFNTLVGASALKFIFRNRIKLIYDSHELTPAVYAEFYNSLIGKIVSKIEIILLKFVDSIITVSYPIKKYLEKVANKDITIISNYPTKDILPKISKKEARNYLQIHENKFIIVYIGTIRKDIALTELVKSVKLLLKRQDINIQVIVIGDGPLYDSIKNLVTELNCTQNIVLLGRISRKKALLYLKAADLSYVVFNAKGLNSYIGMPWKLFESIACGTPILVLGKTYTSSVIMENNFGVLTNDLSKEKIAEAIYEAIQSKIKIKDSIRNNYTWESQENKFIKVYNDIIKDWKFH